MGSLGELQDEGAGRSANAVAVSEIDMRMAATYQVIGDAVINRNVEETKTNWQQVRADAQKDIASVRELVDTAEEKALAEDFARGYEEYMKLFETGILPIIEKEESLAKRAEDAMAIKDIQIRVESVYHRK